MGKDTKKTSSASNKSKAPMTGFDVEHEAPEDEDDTWTRPERLRTPTAEELAMLENPGKVSIHDLPKLQATAAAFQECARNYLRRSESARSACGADFAKYLRRGRSLHMGPIKLKPQQRNQTRQSTGGLIQRNQTKESNGGLQQRNQTSQSTGGLIQRNQTRESTGALQQRNQTRESTGSLQQRNQTRESTGGLQQRFSSSSKEKSHYQAKPPTLKIHSPRYRPRVSTGWRPSQTARPSSSGKFISPVSSASGKFISPVSSGRSRPRPKKSPPGYDSSSDADTECTSSEYEPEVLHKRYGKPGPTFKTKGRPCTPLPEFSASSQSPRRKRSGNTWKNKQLEKEDMKSSPKFVNSAKLGDPCEYSEEEDEVEVETDPALEATRRSIKDKLETCLKREIPFIPTEALDPEELDLFRRMHEIHNRRCEHANSREASDDVYREEDYSEEEFLPPYSDAEPRKTQGNAAFRQSPSPAPRAKKHVLCKSSSLPNTHVKPKNLAFSKLSLEEQEAVRRYREMLEIQDKDLLVRGRGYYDPNQLLHLTQMRFKEKEGAINIATQNTRLYHNIIRAKSVYSREKQLNDYQKHEAFVVNHRPIANLANLSKIPLKSKTGKFQHIRQPGLQSIVIPKPFETRFTKDECFKNPPPSYKYGYDIDAYRSPLRPPTGFDAHLVRGIPRPHYHPPRRYY